MRIDGNRYYLIEKKNLHEAVAIISALNAVVGLRLPERKTKRVKKALLRAIELITA